MTVGPPIPAWTWTSWGRVTHDRVTTLGSGVDGTVRRVSTTYEIRGLPEKVTSYDKNTDTDGLCDDERIYYLSDANFNISTLVNTGGDALERYVYSPYGVLTIYDATWSNVRGSSSYANAYTYTGRYLDAETGLRHRMYHAQLGRFGSRDPIGYQGGLNPYAYFGGMPVILVDPSGLMSPLVPAIDTVPDLRDAMTTLELRHVHSVYFGLSEFAIFFHRIREEGVENVSNIVMYSLMAQLRGVSYHPWTNELHLQTTLAGTYELVLLHEMVHAVDDQNGWYLGLWNDRDSAEALAWGAAHLIGNAPALHGVYQKLLGIKPGELDRDRCEQDIKPAWNAVWRNFADFSGGPGFHVTDAGLLDLREKLGLHFSCSEYLPHFQRLIDNVAGKGCCDLSCPDTLPSSLK